MDSVNPKDRAYVNDLVVQCLRDSIFVLETTRLVHWGIHLSVPAGIYSGGIKLRRNTTDIFIGDTSSNRTRATNWAVGWNQYAGRHPWFMGGTFLDSPNTTSAVTYSFQYQSGYDGNFTVYINRPHVLFNDDASCGLVPSSITCMEVAG